MGGSRLMWFLWLRIDVLPGRDLRPFLGPCWSLCKNGHSSLEVSLRQQDTCRDLDRSRKLTTTDVPAFFPFLSLRSVTDLILLFVTRFVSFMASEVTNASLRVQSI